jgi:hypothetical protein
MNVTSPFITRWSLGRALRRTLTLGAVATALATPGCFAPLHEGRSVRSEPFEPTTKNSDLVFVRTRDRNYYYILDKARRLCFFHAPMYGRDHLASIECATFPDYERLIAKAAGRDHVAPDAEPLDGDSPMADPTSPGSGAGDSAAPAAPTSDATAAVSRDEQRSAFRRAYVQFECGKREGAEEPLEQVLARFQLSADDWDAIATEVEGDDATWNELEAEVDAACPAGKKGTKGK